jgi:hypothetical protein
MAMSPFERLREEVEKKQRLERISNTEVVELKAKIAEPEPAPPARHLNFTDSLGSPREEPREPSVPRESKSQQSRDRLRQRQLNVSINAELADELAAYAMYTKTGITAIVERAIWEFLQSNKPSLGSIGTLGNVGVPFPRDVSDFDDDDDDKQKPQTTTCGNVENPPANGNQLKQNIPRLYEELTGNVFRESDQRFLEEVRQYGVKTIAAAMFVGRSRYTKKINSLRFFQNNILEVAAWEPNKIERELSYQMDMLRKKRGN